MSQRAPTWSCTRFATAFALIGANLEQDDCASGTKGGNLRQQATDKIQTVRAAVYSQPRLKAADLQRRQFARGDVGQIRP